LIGFEIFFVGVLFKQSFNERNWIPRPFIGCIGRLLSFKGVSSSFPWRDWS